MAGRIDYSTLVHNLRVLDGYPNIVVAGSRPEQEAPLPLMIPFTPFFLDIEPSGGIVDIVSRF
jgi:hypothetical protein